MYAYVYVSVYVYVYVYVYMYVCMHACVYVYYARPQCDVLQYGGVERTIYLSCALYMHAAVQHRLKETKSPTQFRRSDAIESA